jgi:uncharacterized protein YacL
MNGAHFHLMINHAPVFGAVAVVGLAVWTKIKRGPALEQLNFIVMTLVGLVSIPAYLTGEPAEKVVEHLPDVTEALIERHEDFAMYGLILGIIIGVLGLIGLYLNYKDKRAFDILWKAEIVIGIIFMAMMFFVSNLGGQIRHTEIRPLKIDTSY